MNRLSIQNFGPVKNAVLELKSFNLLIGEQSIGKSTIAKLIALFTDNSSLAFIASSGIKAWKSRLVLYDLDIYLEDSYKIVYECHEGNIDLIIKVIGKRVYSTLIKNGKEIINKKEVNNTILSMKESFYKDRVMTSLVSKAKEVIQDEDVRCQILTWQSIIESSLYVPAERIAYSIVDNLQAAFSLIGDATTYTYRRFMVSFDKARARIKKYDSSLLGITYLNEEKGQFFLDSESKRKYHLYNASSGIQTAIPLLVVMEDVKNRGYSSIVIEEPETNLFPSTQVEVLKLILTKTRESGRIVTITTHSPYLLSALNNCLYAGFVSKSIDKEHVDLLDEIIPSELRLNSENCSVYSIGESINGNNVYCASLVDEEMGLIDANTLDRVSFKMSEEFNLLQDIYLKYSK